MIAVREFLAAAPTVAPAAPWDFYHYNAARSDAIGALRALPDTRGTSCTARPYHLAMQRARVSIIIAFHNEARSALLRTIMTLYHHTPPRYLHELILIDDCSMDADLLPSMLNLQLPPFMSNFSSSPSMTTTNYASLHSSVNSSSSAPTWQSQVTIKTARNTQRLGVIASRNRGARLATGDYLLFLDSHCEVNVGWLEPLLERLAIGAVAVSPVLDSINAESLEYVASSRNLMGGFDWNLHFHWIPRPQSTQSTQSQPQRRDQYNQRQQQRQAFTESLNAKTAYLQQFGWARRRFGVARMRRDTNTATTAFE